MNARAKSGTGGADAAGPLAGRAVALTGADARCGRGLALGLGDAGAALALLGATDATAQALRAEGVRATAFAVERTARASLAAALGDASAQLGAIDAFVHAAVPSAALRFAPLEDTDENAWDARCDAVVREALVALQAAFDCLSARGGGRIVLLTPTVALAGAAELVPYATAAEALRGLARSAAKQWGAHGITVNCLAPPLEALLDTPQPGARARLSLGDPPLAPRGDTRFDLGPTLAFLASDASAALTGGTFRADGGTWMAG